jgi:hypothetical protein
MSRFTSRFRIYQQAGVMPNAARPSTKGRNRMRTSGEFDFAALRLICLTGALGLASTAIAAPALPVTVVNVPSVNVANQVSVSGSVGVTNTKVAPLFVDTGNSARAAFAATCTAKYDSSGVATCALGSAPAGQILVIETISCNASLVNAAAPDNLLQLPVLLGFDAPALGGGTSSLIHQLVLTHWLGIADSTPPLDYYALSATAVRITGTNVVVQAQTQPPQPATTGLTCAISGYAVAL